MTTTTRPAGARPGAEPTPVPARPDASLEIRGLTKRYGDRVTNELTGPNGGPVETVNWTANADDDLLKRVASLKGGSGG